MVRELKFNGNIDFAPPQVVFELLYADDAFTKFYHMEVSHDPNAAVSSWTEIDGESQRKITFKLKISKLRDLFGVDVAQVTEVQRLRISPNIYTIHSELSTRFIGATLMTSGDTVLSPAAAGGGCEVSVELIVEVQTHTLFRWVLQDPIEDFVETHASLAFKRWLNLARVFCEKKLCLEVGPTLGEEEVFYDVEEEEGRSLLPEPSTDSINRPPSARLRHSKNNRSQKPWFLQVLGSSLYSVMLKYAWLKNKITMFGRSSRFSVRAWVAFGMGIVVGIALVLYMRRLRRRAKGRQKQIV